MTGVTKKGTVVWIMRTTLPSDNLAATLFGKTRRAVLGLLYAHPDEAFYLRQIVRATGAGLGAVQRELKALVEAGIIRRAVRGPAVYFEADPDCPVFAELKSLVVKTVAVADVLRAALLPLAERLRVAFVYGSLAGGQQTPRSDVDLLVVGDVTFSDVVSALGPIQEVLRREVNPTVYSPEEFRAKIAARHHFVCDVVKGPKVFLVGEERELAGLAQQRVAD